MLEDSLAKSVLIKLAHPVCTAGINQLFCERQEIGSMGSLHQRVSERVGGDIISLQGKRET